MREIRAATMFSGIGAPEVAMPHWRWLWHAEIEPFPSAVMAHHHPESVNLGDVSAPDFAERALHVGCPDVIVFGSPCQSFSVAGKRLGLDDPRGNLALVALGVVRQLRPAWVVYENVPGLLSSGGGRDFGAFLGLLGELGYGWAYRVLDAQYFGVAQRRRRVFVVGHLGDWRPAAEVLSFAEGVRWHPPPRREAGEGVAPTLSARTRGGGGLGTDFDLDGGLTLQPRSVALRGREGGAVAELGDEVAHALRCSQGGGDKPHVLAFGGGNTAGPNALATALTSHGGRYDFDSETFVAHASDARQSDVIQYGDMTGPLDTDGHTMAVAFAENSRAEIRLEGGDGQTVASLKTGGGKPGQSYPAVMQAMQVRRLTPEECEALQAFPRGYTAIPFRGKQAADGPRYRALGNSMCVNVVRWILQRVEIAHAALAKGEAA